MKTFSVVSDVTFDLILQKMDSESFSLQSYHFGSVVASLLSPSENLLSADNVIVHYDSVFYRYSTEEIAEILSATLAFAQRYRGNVLISNLWNQAFPANFSDTLGEYADGLKSLEENILRLQVEKNVYFYDFQKLISKIGAKNAYNFQLGHLYQMPYTKVIIEELAKTLLECLLFIASPEKKVIVVDCDETLWSGIVGEDGIDKIQCDKNAKGIIHFYFQQFLKQKEREGFLLCICSKNNERDVVEAFEKKTMPLKYDDFIIKKINWKPKVQNIQEIADELSLGLESFIFIDDSPFEIEAVSKTLPQVKTFLFEKNYAKFLELTENFSFRRKRLTAEDKSKTEQYRAEQARKKFFEIATTFEEYVKQLELRLDISVNNLSEIERYAQMTEKTNQFNFNKEIFSVKDLQAFVEKGNLIFGLKVSDKFGDYGTVGLMLIETEGGEATVRNYLMSCRALGRGVEDKFFEQVLEDLSKRSLTLKQIRFKETSKNKPAQEFYAKLAKRYAEFA